MRHSASESPRVASGSCRYVGSWALSRERNEESSPCRSYVAPVVWSTTSYSSANRAGSASASRAAIAASKRAACAVAAFARTRRARFAAARAGAAAIRAAAGSAVSSSKRASASASRSASNSSMRVSEAVGSEDPELENGLLEGAAAGAIGARGRLAHEERVGSQAEDVVDAEGDVVGDLEQGASAAQERLGSARRTRSRGSGGRRTRRPARAPWRSDRGRTVPPAPPRPSAPSPRRGRARGRRGGARRSARTSRATASPSRSAAKISARRRRPCASTSISSDLARSRRRRHRTFRRRRRSRTVEGGTARASRRGLPAARGGTSGPRPQQRAPRGEQSLPVVRGAGGMVHDLALVGDRVGERVGVAGGERGVEASRVRGRGVRSHAALALRPQLGLARLRIALAVGSAVSSSKRASASARVGVEQLDARHEAIGSEDHEPEEVPLEGAAAGAIGAEVRPAHEERVGSQAEDVVDALGDVVGDLEQGRGALQDALRLRARTRTRGSGGRRTRRRARTPRRSDRGRAVPATPRPSAPSPRRGRARARRGGARRSARTGGRRRRPGGRRRRSRSAGVVPARRPRSAVTRSLS